MNGVEILQPLEPPTLMETCGRVCRAVAENRLDEDTAKRLIEDVDLRQAAQHTSD